MGMGFTFDKNEAIEGMFSANGTGFFISQDGMISEKTTTGRHLKSRSTTNIFS
jgi:hypothetical protein